LKEIRLRPFIADHDFERKIRHADDALKTGEDVVLSVRLRGREIAKPGRSLELLDRAVKALGEVSKALYPPKQSGSVWRVRLASVSSAK